MYAFSSSTSWFGARTVVALVGLVVVAAVLTAAQSQDGCRVECYPNTKLIHGKGASKSDNCRWILRTDGKPARLCDHIKCKKVCPNNPAASSQQDQQEAASSADNLHIEQQLEGDSAPQVHSSQGTESMGIMRQLHGNKLAKAPVPGVAGGRLASLPHAGHHPVARQMAPTLPPTVQYDENDTPPPIARFLDISPEE